MAPINSGERQSAFFVFLAFFIITTLLIVTTVFFGTQVPLVENRRLKQQVKEFQDQQAFVNKFTSTLAVAVNRLQNINNPGVNSVDMDIKVQIDIETLTKQLGTDTTGHAKLFNDAVLSLQQLKSTKKMLREQRTDNKGAAYYKEQLDQALSQLTDCRARIAGLAQGK